MLNAFVSTDDTKIKWTRSTENGTGKGQISRICCRNNKESLYRPFTKSNLYFDKLMNQRTYVFPSIFPTPETELDNRAIWLKVGQEWPMFALMANQIPDNLPQGGSQCFPFYTYNEDGTNRRENITDWTLAQFRTRITEMTPSQSGTSSTIPTASCIIPIIASGIRKTSSAICRISLSPKTSGDLQRQVRGWQTSTSTTNRSPNTINSIQLRPRGCKWICL